MFKSGYIVALVVLVSIHCGVLATPIAPFHGVAYRHRHTRKTAHSTLAKSTMTYATASAEATGTHGILKRDVGDMARNNAEKNASDGIMINSPFNAAANVANDVANAAEGLTDGALQVGSDVLDGAIGTGSQILGAGANLLSGALGALNF